VLRCEEERVCEQTWRARFVVTTVSGLATEFPWSGVCLGRKRAEEAAAEVTLLCIQECIVPPQQIYTPGGEGGGGGFEELEPREKLVACLRAEVAALDQALREEMARRKELEDGLRKWTLARETLEALDAGARDL
jgi:hypothetical protein